MAAAEPSPRRPMRTPARPREASMHMSEVKVPPSRKRYVPGGPGGGGRWLDEQGNETTAPTSVRRQRSDVTADNHHDDNPSSPRSSRRPPPSSARPRTRPRSRTRTRTSINPRSAHIGDPDSTRKMGRQRFSSAAAAAAASQANDGYKPREERSWEEFHPDLDIEQSLDLFSADEVDGRHVDALAESETPLPLPAMFVPLETPVKRKPGRPPKRPESMLSGLGSPPAPRILPLPTHNPKERLNLPKPQYRKIDTFARYEQDGSNQANYVDKSMAHVGYQEGDRFDLPKHTLIRHVDGPYDDDMTNLVLSSENTALNHPAVVFNVEYDMDEQDERWLELLNARRKDDQAEPIKPAIFEITMTQIEREYYALEKKIPKPNPRHAQITRPRSSSAAAVNGEPSGPADEPDTKCAVCDDGDCENANAIIFCDGCDLAVHQECYGVPFIPEGQWFCRRCKELGRGTPICVFCPNVDGAFKQTNTMRWSHLLCALWIPEITIANMTFMEPITDVEKVPKNRWALKCYLCQQQMGACIQCGNKSCFQAFHVTCARRAKLFLRMKSTHTGGIDASVLKAFCDRHAPQEWRNEHDVDTAVTEAKRYYRRHMKNYKWADSSSTVPATVPFAQTSHAVEKPDEPTPADDTIVVAANKRKKMQPAKGGWRLPSGAPVVPAVVFAAVDSSLQRFGLKKRKEFLTEACRYWTLKREARKGAPMLKRLQLSLESFSPMEITRRNFSGMGAAGGPRLTRRIEFGQILSEDVGQLLDLVKAVRKREELSLVDTTDVLKNLIDDVYFPITPLLRPILQRAQKLDEKSGLFKEGFDDLEQKLGARHYISVTAFSADISAVFSAVLTRSDENMTELRDVTDVHNQLNEVPAGTAKHLALTQEQKELKRLTKRIVKAIKDPLEAAMKKEAELKGIPFEKEMSEWAAFDARLENSIQTNGMTALPTMEIDETISPDASVSAVAGASPRRVNNNTDEDVEMTDVSNVASETIDTVHAKLDSDIASVKVSKFKPAQPLSPPNSTSSAAANHNNNNNIDANIDHTAQDTTAPPIEAPTSDPWAQGGVPWYLEAFDISGTTVHEERWTGPDTMRAMSEQLSEMDEETLQDLVGNTNTASSNTEDETNTTSAAASKGRTRSSARFRRVEEADIATVADDDEEDEDEDDVVAETEETEEEEEEEEVQETEEEKAAREKREKANARRRAQRRKNR